MDGKCAVFHAFAPDCNLANRDDIIRYLSEGHDFYDAETKTLLIADMGGDEPEQELYGVMTAPFDPMEHHIRGDFEALAKPVEWALESLPAPGALGAPDHMGWLSVEDAVLWIQDNPFTIADAGCGFLVEELEQGAIVVEGMV